MALRIEYDKPFAGWLQSALSSLRDLSSAPRDVDECEISQKSIDHAAEFLRELAVVVSADIVQSPYVGAGYNGQVVIGWVDQGNRIDLEFYENAVPSVAAFYEGSSHQLSPEVIKIAELVKKSFKIA